jgi:hypothetical protein
MRPHGTKRLWLARIMEERFQPWLGGAVGPELLKPAPEDMLQRWPVSKRVNSSKAPDDDPTLIDRLARDVSAGFCAAPVIAKQSVETMPCFTWLIKCETLRALIKARGALSKRRLFERRLRVT